MRGLGKTPDEVLAEIQLNLQLQETARANP
jgi:hypothetical protein